MNAIRTELEKLQRAQTAALVSLQEQIADGRSPALPEGKTEIVHWHPRIPAFGLRQYATGRGVWVLQYRTKTGKKRMGTIGDAVVLTLKFAEKIASDVLREVAAGNDPFGERRNERKREKHTVGDLVEEYFEAMIRDRKTNSNAGLGPLTLRGYRNVLDNHLGQLRDLEDVEMCRRQDLLVERVVEIENLKDKIEDGTAKAKRNKGRGVVGGPYVANHLLATIQSIYKWGMRRYPRRFPFNPANGIYRPTLPEQTKARCLSFEELGAIWRACETLANAPALYRGKYLEAPVPANSVRDENTWLTVDGAARYSGHHAHAIRDAIHRGLLKATRRRDLSPEEVQERRGKGKAFGWPRRHDGVLIKVADLNEFTGDRLHRMRSPKAEIAAIVRLLILFGARYSEIAGLRWSEIGEIDKNGRKFVASGTPEAIHVPAARTKSRKDLTLYLPQVARDVIKSVPRRPECDLLFGSGGLRGLINNDRLKKHIDNTIAANDGARIAAWRIHDLRHSFTTHLKEEMGIAPHIVEAITNHLAEEDRKSLPAMAGNYTHAKYMTQQESALDAWANRILEAARPDETPKKDNVRQLFGRESA
jgi:integrase